MTHSTGVREYGAVGGGGGGGITLTDVSDEWPRLAQHDWRDPDPDAASFAETWEFSTYGDANQAALESAGWTFSNCTASVAGGLMKMVSTGSDDVRATVTVSLAGDFDIVTQIWSDAKTARTAWNLASNFMIGIPGGVGHLINVDQKYMHIAGQSISTTYDSVPNSGTGIGASEHAAYSDMVMRLCRFSGNVYAVVGGLLSGGSLGTAGSTGATGWTGGTGAEASTYTRMCIAFDGVTAGHTMCVPFIRRYA